MPGQDEMTWTLTELLETLADLYPEAADRVGLYGPHEVLRSAKVRTLEEAGYITEDYGLEVSLRTGEVFLITIQQKK